MNNQSSLPSGDVPVCPHCNKPLDRKGKIGDASFYKKWIEYWSCPTHGQVDPDGSSIKKKTTA